MKPRFRQRGIAALTAILVVAIATVLAVNLLWQTSVEMRRTENLLLQDQARQYDLGGEVFAKFGLAEDFRQNSSGGIDATNEGWARPLAFKVEGGSLEGFLQDQQGRFDLNSLIGADGKRNGPAADQYRRLLTLLDIERPLDPTTAEALVEATIDWLDPDTQPEVNGAEDDRYTSREPPYRPANFWFTSTSELMAIEGYTGEIWSALQPYVTALPRPRQGNSWPLNVNTASALVLASLMENTSADDMKPFVDGTWESTADFRTDVPGAAQIPQDLPLDVRSNWFLLTASASIGTAQSTMYSLLERDGEVVRTRRRTFEAN